MTTAQPRTADVVVIGAGVVGAGVALELARSGRSVTIVERNPGPGQGSTSASSAIVRFNYSTYDGVATSWEAKFGWEDWASYLGCTADHVLARYHRTGVLTFDFPGLNNDRILALYDAVGVPYEQLSPSQITQRFPYFSPERHYPPRTLEDEAFWSEATGELAGSYTADGGFVDDPGLAARNLLDAAVAAGAAALFRRTVTAISTDGRGVCGLTLDDGSTIATRAAVNCAGPHSGVVNRLAGVLDDFRVGTMPLRQEVHQVPGPDGFPIEAGAPVTFDGDLGTYFRPEPGGAILVGGMEPECDPLHWLTDPDATEPSPTSPVYDVQTTRLARRMPGLTVPPRPKGVVGVYDVSDDWIPIYDRTALDGFYVAIGTSGNQFKNAPVIVGHYSRLRQQHAASSRSVLG
ncbi:MAG: FAD-binding oxidoreductase [Actinobacteria bacterium]|nr:FAD-binding oxidoreductase [Actinomycetota bacterium]